jgi:hypothetical protein
VSAYWGPFPKPTSSTVKNVLHQECPNRGTRDWRTVVDLQREKEVLMRLYIGIDWSQSKHDVCFLNQDGSTLAQLVIQHSLEGFWQIEDIRQKLGGEVEDCLLGLETTHNILLDFLWYRGYTELYILGPKLVIGYRSSGGTTHGKTKGSPNLFNFASSTIQ